MRNGKRELRQQLAEAEVRAIAAELTVENLKQKLGQKDTAVAVDERVRLLEAEIHRQTQELEKQRLDLASMAPLNAGLVREVAAALRRVRSENEYLADKLGAEDLASRLESEARRATERAEK